MSALQAIISTYKNAIIQLTWNIWIPNNNTNTVSKVDQTWTVLSTISVSPWTLPNGIVYDWFLYIYILDWNWYLSKINKNTNAITNYNSTNFLNSFWIVFDWTYVWWCKNDTSVIWKFNPWTWTVINTYSWSWLSWPYGMCFDWTNFWTRNVDWNVSKITQAWVITTYTLWLGVWYSICFNWNNLFTVNYTNNSFTQISLLWNAIWTLWLWSWYNPRSISWDWNNLWIANYANSKISKITWTMVQVDYTITWATNPIWIGWFDGVYMWTANYNNTITRIKVSDWTYNVYSISWSTPHPITLCFDGCQLSHWWGWS